MGDVAERAEHLVVERRRYERHAERQPVALEPRRHGDRREVEQVHEVGVVAEVRVQLHRLGFELVDALDRARRRRDEDVDLVPHWRRAALELLQPVVPGKGVVRREALCAAYDHRRDRVQRPGIALDEVADGDVTLGDPGPLVKQPRGFKEWAKVDAFSFTPKTLEAFQHFLEQLRRLRIAKKLELLSSRHAEAQASERAWQGTRRRSGAARERVARIEAL